MVVVKCANFRLSVAEASQHRILSVLERLTDHNAVALSDEDRKKLSTWLLQQAPSTSDTKPFGRNHDATATSHPAGGGVDRGPSSFGQSTCASADVEQRVRRIYRRLVVASARPLRQINGAFHSIL